MPDFANPQDLNRYSYTRNSPLNFVDPSGHALEQSGGGGGLTEEQLAQLWNLYNNSQWQENLPGSDFTDFTQAAILYNYYVDNPEGAWRASIASGSEADSLMWARQYSENVLGQAFLPIDDGILIAAIDKAHAEGDFWAWASASAAMVVTEHYSSQGGGGSSSSFTAGVADDINDWLGANTRIIRNQYGDLVLVSDDGLRRFRADFNHTSPHDNPHMHLDWYQEGEWKTKRIWPLDVKPR